MKRIALYLVLAAALACLAACSSSPKDPATAATQAITNLQKGDYAAYAASFNLNESDQKMLSGMIEEKMKEAIEQKGGIKDFKVTDTDVDDENGEATVKVHIDYKDGSVDDMTMNLVKVDGEWKQELNK